MRWLVLGLLALSTSADAGDAESVTAASAAAAPLPGHESGRIDEGDGGDGAARIAVRGLLFVPKLAIEAVEAPIRGAVWLNARYDVTGAYDRVLQRRAHDRRVADRQLRHALRVERGCAVHRSRSVR